MIIKSIFLCLFLIISYSLIKKFFKQINNLTMIIFYALGSFVLFLINIVDFNYLFLIGSILLAWIQTTPALKKDIPSLIIYKTIFENKGCSEKFLNSIIQSLNLFNEKIEELKLDNLIIEKNGAPKLTFKGRVIAKLFLNYRKILKLPKGEG